MNRFEVSVQIDRSVDEVWEYLNTTENELLWQSSAVERTLLSDGPLVKGSHTSQVDRFLGRRLETKWEVVELTAYERRDRTLSGPFDMEVEWRLEPDDGTTRVTMVLFGSPGLGRLFGKLSDAIVARIAKRDWQANLDTLKDLLENEAD
jgi:uncharacterized protein YndB with AHSA1/START domain